MPKKLRFEQVLDRLVEKHGWDAEACASALRDFIYSHESVLRKADAHFRRVLKDQEAEDRELCPDEPQ